MFQSYQFRQINPDLTIASDIRFNELVEFQSYQFRQINPDKVYNRSRHDRYKTVSIVSIQADQSRHVLRRHFRHRNVLFQSYQFRQINPDVVWT